MKSYDIAATVCPCCGKKLDSHASTVSDEDSREPREGDFTVCIGCATVLYFDKDLQLREATTEELVQLKTDDPGLYHFIADIKMQILFSPRGAN